MHDITDLERRGVPAVFAASTPFVDAAAEQSSRLGFDARAVFVQHPIQDRTDDELHVLADQSIDALISEITKKGKSET